MTDEKRRTYMIDVRTGRVSFITMTKRQHAGYFRQRTFKVEDISDRGHSKQTTFHKNERIRTWHDMC